MAAITILRAYQHSFDTRPNLTLSLTGGTLNAVGDAVAQVTQGVVGFSSPLSSLTAVMLIFGPFFQMQKDKKDQNRMTFDVQRNLRFFCYGMAISALLRLFLLRYAHANVLCRSSNGSVERLPRATVPATRYRRFGQGVIQSAVETCRCRPAHNVSFLSILIAAYIEGMLYIVIQCLIMHPVLRDALINVSYVSRAPIGVRLGAFPPRRNYSLSSLVFSCASSSVVWA